MRLRLRCIAAALLATTPAAAQDTDDDEVLVRGRQTGGFVSRARIEDAPREITDAASLIEPLPGVHVRRLGADDSFATLSIRGSSSAQVAVFLAGVPLTGGADPTLDLATLPLWPGAGVRVHRSFAPASLGRGSLGGTLVLDPPSPRAPERTELWGAVGAFGARRLRLGDIRKVDDVSIATGVSASRSDDDFSYLDPIATQPDGPEVHARRNNAGHAAASGLVSVGMPVRVGAERGALTITALAQARKQELPGPLAFPTPYQRLDSSRLVSALELTLPLGGGSGLARVWGRREGLSIHDQRTTARDLLGPSSTNDAIIALGGSTGYRKRGGRRAIEVRVDGSAERFAPGEWIGADQPPAARRTNGGVAFDGTLGVLEATTLAASARGDLWVDTSDDGTSSTETRPTGNVGIETVLGPIIAATHAGFVARPPSFVERYGNRGVFLGNPTLRPESAFTADLGGRFVRRFGALRLSAEAAVFGTWADDLITFVNRGAYGVAQAENIGHARLFGVEAELRAKFHGLEARASHTSLATANESECRQVDGGCERPPLPGRPTEDFVFDVGWQIGFVRPRYGIDVVSGIRTDRLGTIEVPARVLHSTGARVDVPRVHGLSISIDVRNLFDLRVAEYPGITGPVRAPIGDVYEYPLPGRRILVSARYVFDTKHTSEQNGSRR